MLIYKLLSRGVTPHLVIPKAGGVENQAVDIFIDGQANAVKLYYSYNSSVDKKSNNRNNIWIQHEYGVLPEFFADRLLHGVTAVKVVNNSDSPVVIKIKPISYLSRKHG